MHSSNKFSSFILHVFAQKYKEKTKVEAIIVELKTARENPTAPTPRPTLRNPKKKKQNN